MVTLASQKPKKNKPKKPTKNEILLAKEESPKASPFIPSLEGKQTCIYTYLQKKSSNLLYFGYSVINKIKTLIKENRSHKTLFSEILKSGRSLPKDEFTKYN